MARLDRARLGGDGLPVALTVATRIDDLDINGHVNNAATAVLLQEGRARFHQAAGVREHMAGRRLMVAALGIEFAAELGHPAPVEVRTGVLAIGRTSYTLGQCARQDGRDAVFAEAVMVTADADGPAPLPPGLRAALEAARAAD